MMICVAGVDDYSGRGCGARFRSFALRLIRCSVMISGRGVGVCGGRRCADNCGGLFPASRIIVSTAGRLCLLAVSRRFRMM